MRLRSHFLSLPTLALAGLLALGHGASNQGGAHAYSASASPTGYGDYLAARHAENLHDLAAASRYFDSALANDPQNAALMQKSLEMALSLGEFDKALGLAKTLSGLEVNNDLATMVMSLDAFRTRSYRVVGRTDLESVDDPVYYLVLKAMKAWSLAGLDRHDEALAVMQGENRYQWEGWFVSYIMAQIEDMRGQSQKALDLFHPVYLAQQDVGEIAVTLAILHARAGSLTTGEAALQKYLANRSDIEVQAALNMLGTLAERPIVASPQQAVSLLLSRLASDLTTQKEFVRALQLVKMGAALGANADTLAFQESQIFFSMQRYEEALAAAERISRESPVRQKALVLRAVAYDLLERPQEALELLELSLEGDYSNLEAIMLLGDLLRGQEQFDKAAATYSRAISQHMEGDMRFWRFYFNRGIAYERAGQWAKAEPDFLKALEMSPNHPKILNYLGYSWIDQGLNLEEAIAMVEKAVAIAPNDGFIVDSLGWGLYRLGRFEEAVEELEKAVQLEPTDPVINDHLGDAYWQVGRVKEAHFQWQRALENEPETGLAEVLEKKLRNGLVAEAGQ